MADDIDKVIKAAKTQGFDVRTDADGYRRFYNPDGEYLVRYPATPSNPRRRLRDTIVTLRAAGFEWPPPSKSIQRSRRRKEQS